MASPISRSACPARTFDCRVTDEFGRSRITMATGYREPCASRGKASAKLSREFGTTVRAPDGELRTREIHFPKDSTWIEVPRAPGTAHLIALECGSRPDKKGRQDGDENREVDPYENPVWPDPIHPPREQHREQECEDYVRDDLRASPSLPESAPIVRIPRVCLATDPCVSILIRVLFTVDRVHARSHSDVASIFHRVESRWTANPSASAASASALSKQMKGRREGLSRHQTSAAAS